MFFVYPIVLNQFLFCIYEIYGKVPSFAAEAINC